MSVQGSALTKQEKLELFESSLKHYYHEGVIPALAVVISIAEKYPEQTDNQVRNAMTHYARALFEVESDDEFRSELRQAENHLKRGVRDAYKIVLIYLGNEIRSLYESVIYSSGQLPPRTFEAYQAYINFRRSLFNHESTNKLDQFVESVKQAGFEDIDDPFIFVVSIAIDTRDELIQLTKGTNVPSQLVLKAAKELFKWQLRLQKSGKWVALAILSGLIGVALKTAYDSNWNVTTEAQANPEIHIKQEK